MELLPQEVTRPRAAARGLTGALLLLASGCVTTEGLLTAPHGGPPSGPVSQVYATWHNQAVFAPDPARGGTTTPGLAGRLYLFGPDMGYPVAGDGGLVIDLFDPAQPGPDGVPKHLERWLLDAATLKQCLRRDTIGWGYTLLLPWGTYRPDITGVILKARYDPAKGAPIYASPMTVTLNAVQDFTATTASRPITPAPKGMAAAAGNGEPVARTAHSPRPGGR